MPQMRGIVFVGGYFRVRAFLDVSDQPALVLLKRVIMDTPGSRWSISKSDTNKGREIRDFVSTIWGRGFLSLNVFAAYGMQWCM